MMMDNARKSLLFDSMIGDRLHIIDDDEDNAASLPTNASACQKIAAASQKAKLKLWFVIASSLASILLNVLSILINSSKISYATLSLVSISAPFLIKNEIDMTIIPDIRKLYNRTRTKYNSLARINKDLQDANDELDDIRKQ